VGSVSRRAVLLAVVLGLLVATAVVALVVGEQAVAHAERLNQATMLRLVRR
jgi:hypothetical protein